LPESGLDVYESLSPWPLTELKLEDALSAWPDPIIIWGGIPSPLLGQETDEDALHQFLDTYLDMINLRPTIVGIGDQVMPDSLIERVKLIAQKIA
jgi:hypothetical protein